MRGVPFEKREQRLCMPTLDGFAILYMLLWYHAAMSRITPGPNEN